VESTERVQVELGGVKIPDYRAYALHGCSRRRLSHVGLCDVDPRRLRLLIRRKVISECFQACMTWFLDESARSRVRLGPDVFQHGGGGLEVWSLICPRVGTDWAKLRQSSPSI